MKAETNWTAGLTSVVGAAIGAYTDRPWLVVVLVLAVACAAILKKPLRDAAGILLTYWAYRATGMSPDEARKRLPPTKTPDGQPPP